MYTLIVWCDGRYAAADFLEPIFEADTAFAPSIYIVKMTIDDNKCYKCQLKKGTFIELSVNHGVKKIFKK